MIIVGYKKGVETVDNNFNAQDAEYNNYEFSKEAEERLKGENGTKHTKALSDEELEMLFRKDQVYFEFDMHSEGTISKYLTEDQQFELLLLQKCLGKEKIHFGYGSMYSSAYSLREDYYYSRGSNFFHCELLKHPDFPFGYQATYYERHKKIMNRRFEDIKTKQLDIPNFKEAKRYGLQKMEEYLNDKDNRFTKTRPLVQGKTLTITSFSHFSDSYKSKSDIINFTFLNKFENVMHPMNYFVKYNYDFSTIKEKASRYQLFRLESFFADFQERPGSFFETFDWYCSDFFDIICFNIFTLPLRAIEAETFMNFLIAFHKKYPHIYIKDISGRGYNAYRKYSFYENLLKTKIDIHVIK